MSNTNNERKPMFEIVSKIATSDGTVFDDIDDARKHELTHLFENGPQLEKSSDVAEVVIRNYGTIHDIMTSQPGKPAPKPRKTRKDKGVKRANSTPPGPAPEPAVGVTVEGSGKYRGK